jgi:hypothetical protein
MIGRAGSEIHKEVKGDLENPQGLSKVQKAKLRAKEYGRGRLPLAISRFFPGKATQVMRHVHGKAQGLGGRRLTPGLMTGKRDERSNPGRVGCRALLTLGAAGLPLPKPYPKWLNRPASI